MASGLSALGRRLWGNADYREAEANSFSNLPDEVVLNILKNVGSQVAADRRSYAISQDTVVIESIIDDCIQLLSQEEKLELFQRNEAILVLDSINFLPKVLNLE